MAKDQTDKKRKLEDAEVPESSSKKARQNAPAAKVAKASHSLDNTRNKPSTTPVSDPQVAVGSQKDVEGLTDAVIPVQKKRRRVQRKKTPAERQAKKDEQAAKDEEEMRSAIGTDEYFDAIVDMQDDLAQQSEAEAEQREKEREERELPLEEREQRARLEKGRRKQEKTARKADRKRVADLQTKAENKSLQPRAGLRGEDSAVKAKPNETRLSNSVEGDAQQPRWTLSSPTAGRYLNLDPVFVRDANNVEHLLTATQRNVQLLSLEDSLLVRSYAAPETKSIVSFAVGSERADTVHIALDDGSLLNWNWQDDTSAIPSFTSVGDWRAMTIATDPTTDEEQVIYLTQVDKHFAVCMKDESLYTTPHELQSIRVLGDMNYIIAQGPSVVAIGARATGQDSKAQYVWVEMPMATLTTCFDARLNPTVGVAAKKDRSRKPGLSIATGNSEGQIHLYEDISALFAHKERASISSPRILHWHREAVNTVRFSQDGNYLISGGKETVLVLWQLQTGKKQFLPHLTSVIKRVVVSPNGDRYAVQMGDNSIMVLSTSELKPVANFAGLQLVSDAQSYLSASNTAVLHPQHSNQLLLTVPASVHMADARPFLQTFDTRSSRHMTRQALTRNNVTDFNLGPEETPIIPPDVKYMQISQDGRWLATIDEWMPPAADLAHLAADNIQLRAEREKRREVHLKFWHWDEAQNLWVLATRVDSPHARAGDPLNWAAGQVLQLVSEPQNNGFATVGEDGRVKIWKPKTKVRQGVIMTDANNQDVIEWTCKRTIELPKDGERADSPMIEGILSPSGLSTKACLAYSGDGSILAATITDHEENKVGAPLLHFIDARRGTIAATKAGILPPSYLYSLGFLDRNLIVVAHQSVQVWDLVDETLRHHHKIPDGEAKLAIQSAEGTYAVAVGDKVTVYRISSTTPACKMECDSEIAAVLAGGAHGGGKGYVLLCEDATIRTLSSSGPDPTRKALLLPSPDAEEDALAMAVSTEVDEVGMESEMDIDMDSAAIPLLEEAEDDRAVVRPEQLADIFDVGQSFAMPPVRDMFEAVVGLFGRKPHERVDDALVTV